MDRKITQTASLVKHKQWLYLLAIIALIIGYLWSQDNNSIHQSELVFAKVQNGAVDKPITGIGKIVTQQSWQITAEQAGTLIEVFKQPGDTVARAEVILQLKNPRLQEELASLKADLVLLKTELASTKLRLEAQYSQEKNNSEKAKLRLNTAQQELQASKELADKGIVSALQLATIEAKTQEAKLDFEMSKSALVASAKIIDAELLLKQGNIDRTQAKIDNLNKHIALLQVKSPISGVLQSVKQTYGAFIAQGDSLATVSDTSQMKAVFYLPEQDINAVSLGKEVILRSSQGEFKSTVSLLNPSIKDGAIEVEAALLSNFPTWVKPDLPIQAIVQYKSGIGQIYVEKPANVISNSQNLVYRLDKKRQMLVAVKVDFGNFYEQYIEVKKGLKQNDIIVLSSSQQLKGDEITIINGEL